MIELVEGPTLADRIAQGAIPVDEALPIAKQIAQALEAAHEQGIIHRDLKPANIKVRSDGTVKVLDFGLAKAIEPAGAGAQANSSQLPTITAPAMTQTGAILGTAAYMSPEQAEGRPLDRRSDIFSFGAVLYEVVAGRRAFGGDSTARVLSSVLRDEPQPLGGSSEFDRVVQRCLRKSPMERYASMRDVRAALDAAGRTQQLSGRPAIAVLPFTNMSADPENQYFSDGLAEELINALTRLPGLQVASRTSAFRFRGSDADIRQVGRDLQVSTVVEGSVRRSGHRLRVTAQLINVADGYHLWSERYDREMADVFDIQDDIVESIVKAVAPTLVGDARTAVRRPTENLEAYELYLKGRHHWHLRTPSAMEVAQQVFEQVIALEPEYALAWAGVADCLSVRRVYGWASAAQLGARAREAATRALELDPSLAEANFAQAAYILYFEPDWRRAEGFLRRAIEINPRFVGALGYLALVLVADDDRDEVTTLIDRARDADPLSTYVHYMVACAYFIGRRFGEAQGAAQRVLELQPDALPGLWPLGLALSGLERHQAAVEAMERAATLSRAPFYVGMLGLVLARAGRSDDARRLLGELEERSGRGEYVGPQNLLAIHVGLGDRAAIRGALQACIADATPYFTVRVTMGPFLDAYLADPDIAQVHEALDGWRTR